MSPTDTVDQTLDPDETKVVRFLAVVPGRTALTISVACDVDIDMVESLCRRGMLVRKVDASGDAIHFASLSGVQEAMSGVTYLPDKLEWSDGR